MPVVRAEVPVYVNEIFVEATRAIGAGFARLLLRHELPNTLSSVIVLGVRRSRTAVATSPSTCSRCVQTVTRRAAANQSALPGWYRWTCRNPSVSSRAAALALMSH